MSVEKTRPLSNGTGEIPVVGLGSWTVFGEQGNPEQVGNAVREAIDAGYRHLDCAWNYGTEASIGEAIQEKIQAGVITRQDMFITTKLWDTHHNPKLVMKALKDSLNKLKVSYVDLYLIHWPCGLQDDPELKTIVPNDESGNVVFANHKLEDIWKAVEECQKAGLAKNIGLSNFNSKQTQRILDSCTIKPTAMQVEITPYFSNRRLVDFCQERGMVVTAYAPLGAPNRPWKEADEPHTFEDPTLIDIAKNKGRSIAQVVLRYHLQNGVIVIPKSITATRIRENISVFDFELSKTEMSQIASLNRDLRVFKEPICIGHPEYPFDEPF